MAEDSQAATNGVQSDCRVIYVGTGRKPKFRLAFLISYEDERTWRQSLASEMEEVCRDMMRQGLHLTHVVPVTSSGEFRGGWTEGTWLYFAT